MPFDIGFGLRQPSIIEAFLITQIRGMMRLYMLVPVARILPVVIDATDRTSIGAIYILAVYAFLRLLPVVIANHPDCFASVIAPLFGVTDAIHFLIVDQVGFSVGIK